MGDLVITVDLSWWVQHPLETLLWVVVLGGGWGFASGFMRGLGHDLRLWLRIRGVRRRVTVIDRRPRAANGEWTSWDKLQ